MAVFSVRVSDEIAARFDAAADQAGGRSALLRRLIAGAAGPLAAAPAPPARALRGARIMVRLTPDDLTAVDAEARALALTRATWVAALVRGRVRGRPTFSRGDELALRAIQGELRRVGVNVNQIARALNTAVLEGRVLDLELDALADLQAEMRAHVLALREAFEGNLAYWAVGA